MSTGSGKPPYGWFGMPLRAVISHRGLRHKHLRKTSLRLGRSRVLTLSFLGHLPRGKRDDCKWNAHRTTCARLISHPCLQEHWSNRSPAGVAQELGTTCRAACARVALAGTPGISRKVCVHRAHMHEVKIGRCVQASSKPPLVMPVSDGLAFWPRIQKQLKRPEWLIPLWCIFCLASCWPERTILLASSCLIWA